MLKGALLGDFVKGPLRGQYTSDIERGIQLHRRIDAFSGADDDLKVACRTLPPELQRYAGIITDVVFDFFLSHHWHRFHPDSLPVFAQSVYGTIEQANESWPDPARRFSERMIEYDLLCQYGEWTTVERVLASISTRLSRENPLGRAARQIEPQLAQLEASFLDFYPRLQRISRQFIQTSIETNT